MFFYKNNPPYSWITSEQYRQVIAHDKEEAEICYKNKAYNACQVMLGSVMEGTLRYAMIRKRISFNENATLENLLSLAKTYSLLPQGETYLGQMIRDYRNLVHPGKQLAENRTPTRESAELARKACEFVLSELQKSLVAYLPADISAYILRNGEMFKIQSIPFTLGRSKDNSLVLDSTNLSKYHAQVTFEPDENKFYLIDLKSTNGTYVWIGGKERKTNKFRLDYGTKFRLGKNGGDPEFIFGVEGEEGTTPQK